MKIEESPKPEPGENYLETSLRHIQVVFTHLLPGVFVLGATYIRHPAWFDVLRHRFEIEHLITLAAVALAFGNLIFAINRYLVMQVVDMSLGTVPERFQKYVRRVANEIRAFYGGNARELRQLVRFRASAALLSLSAAEALGYACLGADQHFASVVPWLWWLAGLALLAAATNFALTSWISQAIFGESECTCAPSSTRKPSAGASAGAT